MDIQKLVNVECANENFLERKRIVQKGIEVTEKEETNYNEADTLEAIQWYHGLISVVDIKKEMALEIIEIGIDNTEKCKGKHSRKAPFTNWMKVILILLVVCILFAAYQILIRIVFIKMDGMSRFLDYGGYYAADENLEYSPLWCDLFFVEMIFNYINIGVGVTTLIFMLIRAKRFIALWIFNSSLHVFLNFTLLIGYSLNSKAFLTPVFRLNVITSTQFIAFWIVALIISTLYLTQSIEVKRKFIH